MPRFGRSIEIFVTIDEGDIQVTGIPPHIAILKDVRDMKDELLELKTSNRELPNSIIQLVVTELERRAIGAGTVTRDGLEELLMDCLRRDVVSLMNNPVV
jgi:hypothetical protein